GRAASRALARPASQRPRNFRRGDAVSSSSSRTLSRLAVYDAKGHQSRLTVSISTFAVTLLTTQRAIQAAPTSRKFRESDEIASMSAPAETTITDPNATDPASSLHVSRTTPISRLKATPSK